MQSKLFVFLTLLVVISLLGACAPMVPAGERTLTVTGNGKVYLTPDVAYLYVGVHTESADLAKALEQNNQRTAAVIEAMKKFGVAAGDIQTSNFSVWSSQDFDGTGTRYIKYSVDNTVSVTIRDLSQVGAFLNAAIDAGANTINSLTFDVENKSAALSQARQKALENAGVLAQELASQVGLKVGAVKNIVYSEVAFNPYYGMGGGGGSEASVNIPIQPGKIEVSATITVTYELNK